ncbi:unnamed protein product [Effrenium voratum]|uniref:ABM domain-containing protein n=1 Tax=Effrenium voratum TaxID=2562239 RepID=A0AA36I5A2_9DINO|nr:unnamed protein product [Effrenium voratum]
MGDVGPVRVCATFNVKRAAFPSFCEAAGRVSAHAGVDDSCQGFSVHQELGWSRQVSDQAQSLFMVVQEWKSAEALEEHVRSAAAQRFDRDLKDGDMLACAPNLSLFGKELSVQELRAIAAEARASGQEEEEAYSPPAPAAQAAQAAQATSGSMTASKGYRKAAEKSSGRGNSRAWK